tara:strand:- start:2102 stop:2482 length:381 start_codon:yes stop_codon:yes gene_type:complete
MRVSISYSIDLEETPEKVKELLQKDVLKIKREVLPDLDQAIAALSAADINRVAVATGEVERAKEAIQDVATKLVDYSTILKGFLNAKIQLAQQARSLAQESDSSTPTSPLTEESEQAPEQNDEPEV